MISLTPVVAPPSFLALASRELPPLRQVIVGRGAPKSADFNHEVWKRHKRGLTGDAKLVKCGFCERRREPQELNIEHYRPKAELTRWEGSPNEVLDAPPRQHPIGPGCWWLAYDWQNYALACGPCNQTWKRNLFPLASPIGSPWVEGVELNEQPQLLHPYEPFNTCDHFAWDLLGYIHSRSKRGRATIITCGLNRTALVAERQRKATELRSAIDKMRQECSRPSATARARWGRLLWRFGDGGEEFAGMIRWFVEEALDRPWPDCFDKDGAVVV